MLEYSKICEKMRYGGILVLNIVMNFPEREFLREIAEASLNWAKTSLFDKICAEYESSSDPKKKFKFGYEYKFNTVISCCRDGIISTKTDVSLKDRRTGKIMYFNELGLVIRESDGAILPIEAVADRKTVKKYRKGKGKGFYLTEKGLEIIYQKERDEE